MNTKKCYNELKNKEEYMYDFENIIDRRNQGSRKWLLMKELKPNVGDDVMPFSVADMEFKNPPELVEDLKKFLDEMVLGYTTRNADFDKAIVSWMKRRHNFDLNPEWLVHFQGVVSGIYNAILEFTEAGDGIIVMPPVYYPFFTVCEALDRKIVECPLINGENGYEINFELFEKLIADDKNKALLFCSPHNPVGRVWRREELQRLADAIVKNKKYLFADEIHNDFVMPGYEHTIFQTLSDELKMRTITFTSASKTFNMAGMDLCSVIVSNDEMRERFINRATNTARISPTALGYKATEICYNKCEKWLDECIDKIEENSKLVREYMNKNHPEVKVSKHEGTYLLWLDFSALGVSKEELEKNNILHDVFLDEGYIFGTGGECFERINLAAPTKYIKELLTRITNAINALK